MGWLLVFVGGGVGSLARYGLARWLPPAELAHGEVPWHTLAANLLACAVLAAGVVLVSRGTLGKEQQLLVLTGFCGGFSTFSTFALETLTLGEEGHYTAAAVYLGLSVVGGVAVLLGTLALLR